MTEQARTQSRLVTRRLEKSLPQTFVSIPKILSTFHKLLCCFKYYRYAVHVQFVHAAFVDY